MQGNSRAPLPARSENALRRTFKRWLNRFPQLSLQIRRIYFSRLSRGFGGSARYWERRYNAGRDSGAGSYGALAAFKAEILNRFVREQGIETVVELGCGDGAQLRLAEYPAYLGVDVSPSAIARCRALFRDDPSKSFDGQLPAGRQFDLALSLDVVYHLVEDEVFEAYMAALFGAARRNVIVYSSNRDGRGPEPHIRHRKFTDWVRARRPDWRLREAIPNRHPFDPRDPENSSFADFYIFEKRAAD